jgi:C4-dicarboxylate transporter, DctM subunit
MNSIDYIGIGVIAILFNVGSPLAVAFAAGSIIIFLFSMGFPVANVAQIAFGTINSYSLLAMPFFILAGNLILRSGGMVPLREFMNVMVGHWPGGMAVASIIFAAFLGSISGSAAACLAIIGTLLVPMLTDSGYDRPFAAGMGVVAAEIGMLIPPSIFFIIFGAYNQISIADLFMSGIGPGLLTAFFMCIAAVVISKRRKYRLSPRATWPVRWKAFKRVFVVLLMPLIVLGGIYSGTFSPTQAAAVSVYYALGMGVIAYRELTWKGFVESLVDTAKLASMIYLMFIGGDLFGKVLGYIGLPQMIAEWVLSYNLGPIGFLLVVEVLLLAMGFFFSSIPMVIIVLPLFIPSAKALGIDLVFYGNLAIICALIGEITPPMGPQLWIAAPICKVKMGAIIREAWVFLGCMTLALLLSTFFPQIPMYMVGLMH